MLVLSRKQNEQIIIGENVRIKVMMIRGNQVRLALEAAPPGSDLPRGATPSRPPTVRGGDAHGGATPGYQETGYRDGPRRRCGIGGDGAKPRHAGASNGARGPRRPGRGHPPQIRALLQQIARLRSRLRDRGPDNVLLRWLDNVQRQLEDLQHLDTAISVSTSG